MTKNSVKDNSKGTNVEVTTGEGFKMENGSLEGKTMSFTRTEGQLPSLLSVDRS